MDSLTQIVLGAATAEAVSGRKLGNRAILYGAILGTIPDLDVFVGSYYDIVTSNEIHRGFSHSILFFLMATPLLGMVLLRLERKRGLTVPEAFTTVFLCLFTHALLDAFTNWGTQLFWPFETRVAIQSIFVIDPLYTIPLMYCLVRAMLRKKDDPKRKRWTFMGIYISSGYLFLTLILQAVATDRFESALARNGIGYSEISVRPSPLNTILWNANVSVDGGYLLAEYSFFDTQAIRFQFYPRNEHLLQGIENDPMILRLKAISENWYIITKQDGRMFFNDLRFGTINDDVENPEFVFRYELSKEDGSVIAREGESPSRDEPAKLLRRLWARMWGN